MRSRGRQSRLLLGASLALLPLAGASAESLTDTLAKAYLSNPTLAAERANQRSIDEDLPQALAQRRPTVIGQAQAGGEVTSSSGFTSAGRSGNQTLWPRGTSLTVTQPLWTGGRADAAISQADYLIQAERANLLNTEESVLLQAATAYFDVVNNQAVLDLAISNVKVLTQSLDETNARFKAGLATKTDVAQSEASLQQGYANQRQAEANLVNSRAAYRNAVGDWPGTLKPEPPASHLPVSVEEAVKQASENNPQVLFAQLNQQAAAAGVDVANAQLMPSLSLQGSIIDAQDSLIRGDKENSAEFLVTITVPFYQAGAEYSRIRQAKETLGQNQQKVDAAVRLATQDATQDWQNLEAARATIKSFEAQVAANTIAFQGIVEENRVGTRTTLDVLITQQNLFQSQVSLVNAQHNEAVSSYTLKADIGDLTAERMGMQTPIYKPTAHYDAVKDKWIGTTPPPD